MPSQTSAVGPLTLPIPAGTANSRIADPAVDGLLDYCAFWIKNALDTKLANITGTSADAVPTANRFAFDPLDPRGHKVKLPVPALFAWWNGDSKVDRHSTVYRFRTREIHVLYVFQELPSTESMELRAGLMNAADAALHKASERGYHPLYSYGGDPLGTPLRASMGGLDVFDFDYVGGHHGRFGADGQRVRRSESDGRDFPALFGRFAVQERIEADTLEDPADVDGDTSVTIRAMDDEPGESVTILERFVPASDGTDPDEDT